MFLRRTCLNALICSALTPSTLYGCDSALAKGRLGNLRCGQEMPQAAGHRIARCRRWLPSERFQRTPGGSEAGTLGRQLRQRARGRTSAPRARGLGDVYKRQEGHILAEEPASSNEEVRDIIEQYTGDTSCSLVVTRVWVRGPFEVLRGGMSLVDLPGEFGANTFRTSVAREYISSSSSPIWVVAAVDQRVHAMMHVRTLIRQLVLDGMIPRCRFILTRADKMGARGQRTIGMMIESGCGLCASPLFEPITT